MAGTGRSGEDDPGALLFGDDDYDEQPDDDQTEAERSNNDRRELTPPPKQRSLWDAQAQDDEERAPTQPVRSAVEDLRYQGPISMDDADEPLDEAEDPGAGTGRVFFAAALIGGVIITMFAVALYYRGSGDQLVASTVAKNGGDRRPALSAPATTPSARPDPLKAGSDPPSGISDVATLPHTTSPPIEYRPVPGSSASTTPAPPSQVAAIPPAPSRPSIASGSPETANAGATNTTHASTTPTNPVERLQRPAPVAASHVTPASSGTRRPNNATVASTSLTEIARRGRGRLAAAPAGSWTVQVIVACQPANVEKAFRSVESPNLVAIPVELKGQSCYRLCWGVYPDQPSAERAVRDVPEYFSQNTRPQPVAVSKVVGR
ncbi:MAG: hypothetical protein U0V87_02260 [Acidobacteriota bacterium]